MKNLTFVLLITLVIVSCKQEKSLDYAIISGEIKNANTVYIRNILLDVEKEIHLKDGNFKDTIPMDMSNQIQTVYDGTHLSRLYLTTGSDISITYDTKNYETTFSIEGKGREENNYLFQKRKLIPDKKTFEHIFSRQENEFKKEILNIKQENEKLLDRFKVSKDFKIKELNNIHYSYLKSIDNYTFYYHHFTKKKAQVSKEFDKEIQNLTIDIDNYTDYYYSEDYKDFFINYLDKQSKLISEKDSIHHNLALLKIVSNIKNDAFKSLLMNLQTKRAFSLHLYDKSHLNDFLQNHLDEYYTLYKANSIDKESTEIMTKRYQRIKKLLKGNLSPKFVDYENYAGGTSSLDDFKGKYVYIDFWATWCKPCIAEFPALESIQGKYKNKNIVFLSISVDRQIHHEKWRKMIDNKELKGIQLFADKDFDSEFVKDYMVQGIPRFILLSPTGEIIDIDAPRPSDSKLIDIFNELKI